MTKTIILTTSKIYNIKSLSLILFLALFITAFSSAQDRRGMRPGGRMNMKGVMGMVIDAKSQVPIEYATVILFNKIDSSKIDGSSTNERGRFVLPDIKTGEYFLQISFIGYEIQTIEPVSITDDKPRVMVGRIELKPQAVQLGDIDVSENKASIEYKLDKKIINVSEQLTATSGTAVDILENAPSVQVDVEGNVSLRGSSNFTLLIDGKPSVLDAADALEQIPSSSIDNIEIITNPSAKYDPDGTSGIINIVLKKNSLLGFSGMVESNGGNNDNYGGSFLLSYKTESYNATGQIDYSNRSRPGESGSENRTIFNNETSFINSLGTSSRDRDRKGIRANIDFPLSDKDILSFSARVGKMEMARTSATGFDSWSDISPSLVQSSSDNSTLRTGDFYSISSDYKHTFGKRGHELSARIYLNSRDMDEETTTMLFDGNGIVSEAEKSFETGPGSQVRLNLDYSKPFSANGKFETGYQSRIGKAEDNNSELTYNTGTGIYELDPLSIRKTEYNRDIHSLYALYANGTDKFGYQFGLRGEYMLRDIILVDSSEQFSIDRWDYFPTAHVSYSISEQRQMMASYTRRIKRARGWYFEPFISRTDPYNFRQGNPDLKPEYINSFEFGFTQMHGKSMTGVEVYHRITENKVEFIQTVYDTNTTLRTIENVGKDYATGVELMANIGEFDFWDINCMVNLYNYKVEGEFEGTDFSFDDFSWNIRMNNIFNISERFRLQLNNMYRSNSVTSQGENSDAFMSSIALRANIIDKQMNATLQVRDIFGASKRESYVYGDDYYKYSFSESDAPTISLNITYLFNNYKQERRQPQQGGNDASEDDF